MARPFFVSLSVRCRWGPVLRPVACQRDDDAGTDVGAFGDESLGEVAIADGEVAVTEGDIEA